MEYAISAPDGLGGDYIIFNNTPKTYLETLCWSILETTGSGLIGIGRDSTGSIVAIHLPWEN